MQFTVEWVENHICLTSLIQKFFLQNKTTLSAAQINAPTLIYIPVPQWSICSISPYHMCVRQRASGLLTITNPGLIFQASCYWDSFPFHNNFLLDLCPLKCICPPLIKDVWKSLWLLSPWSSSRLSPQITLFSSSVSDIQGKMWLSFATKSLHTPNSTFTALNKWYFLS